MPTEIRPAASTVIISLLTAALVGFLGGGLAGSLNSTGVAFPGGTGGTSGESASASPSASGVAEAALTLTADAATVRRGQSIKLSGKVNPARDGLKVQVQRRVDGGDWTNFPVSATTAKSGAFSTTVQSSRVGRNDFRVAASLGGETVVSEPVPITIT